MAYQIAAYLRLSIADGDIDKEEKDESNSIQNQRKLIQHYLNTIPEFSTGEHQDYEYHEYIDDGISGTTTRFRPSFLHMIKDAERHRINCIIVKDFSRFSREALVLGDYIEQIFPMNGIRFIAINDHYDSRSGNSAGSAALLAVSMKALVNEYYAKDISKKKTASVRSRLSQGAVYGPVPYGYRRNADREIEIDPETSPSILRIFELALTGQRLSEICRIMTTEGFLTPFGYAEKHPEKKLSYRNYNVKTEFWSFDTVRNILHNPAYIGILVTGKTHTTIPCSHKRVLTEPEDHFVTENVFPPLVTKETFDRVQELYPLKTRKESRANVNPKNPKCNILCPRRTILLGHLRCGYCGKAIRIDRHGSRCFCSNARYQVAELCSAKKHKISDIEAALLPQIKERCQHILEYEKQLQNEIREARQKAKDLSFQVALQDRDLEKLLTQKQSNYENFVKGNISMTQFQMMEHSLRAQIQAKRQALAELHDQIETYNSFTISTDLQRITETIAAYPDAELLTEEMVDVMVDHLVLSNDSPYVIHWKYDEKGAPIHESTH